MYTISEISKMFSIPTSTIRYYEQIGLLENVEHVNNYHRVYTQDHVDKLHAIECFKKATLPLDDIRTFFQYEKDMATNSTLILDMMKNQEKKTKQAIASLEAGLAHVQLKVRYYTMVDEAVKTGKPIPDWSAVSHLE